MKTMRALPIAGLAPPAGRHLGVRMANPATTRTALPPARPPVSDGPITEVFP